jgi:hypothetical protein
MTGVARLGARLLGAAGRVYEALPQGVTDVLGVAHPLVAMARDAFVPLAVAHGRDQAAERPASVLVAGDVSNARYFLERFFLGPFDLEPRGHASLAAMPALLRQERKRHDVTIARVDRIASEWLFGPEYHRLPDWVDTTMTVPLDLGAFVDAAPRSLRSDLVRIKRLDLRWSTSRAPEDFERSYAEMHLPFLAQRHGELGVALSVHRLRRMFRAGCLLWVFHAGEVISATLLMPRGEALKFAVLGTRDGTLEARAVGGLAALYLFTLQYAGQIGLRTLDLGGVRPCLSDGVLQYKSKWGVRMRPKADVYHDVLVYWPRLNDGVRAFLASHPLVVRRGRELARLDAQGAHAPLTIAASTPRDE